MTDDQPKPKPATGRTTAADPYAASGEPTTIGPARERIEPVPPATPQPAAFTAVRTGLGLGIVRYQGRIDDPLRISRALAKFSPLHLIVNRVTLTKPLSVEITSPTFLWDWYPPETLEHISPILLSDSEGLDLHTILSETWPQQSVVCVFSQQEHEPLADHLQTVIRGGKPAGNEPPSDVFPIYLSKVVRGLLPHATGKTLAPRVEQLVAHVDGLLVPADTPAEWELFCTSKFDAGASHLVRATA